MTIRIDCWKAIFRKQVVLSVRPKITDLNFHLFARSIHPELFEVCASRTLERESYTLMLNITTDGHAISFVHDGMVLTEVSAGAHHPLPVNQILLSHPIEGTCHNTTTLQNKIGYQTQVQLECVPPKTFVAIKQQLDHEVECEGLIHRFQSNGRIAFGAISYINIQAFRRHVKVRTFHTFPDTCAVIKSDTRFSLDLD
jgi:hypothetical protein